MVLRSVSFVMTPPAVSTPVSKRETSKSSKSCACEDASPEKVATKKNPISRRRAKGMPNQGQRRRRHAKPTNRNATEDDCKDQQNDVTLESMHVPRAGPPALPCHTGGTRSGRRSRLDVPPHGALGGFALTAAALVASTLTSSSGVGRLGDGGRGASKR